MAPCPPSKYAPGGWHIFNKQQSKDAVPKFENHEPHSEFICARVCRNRKIKMKKGIDFSDRFKMEFLSSRVISEFLFFAQTQSTSVTGIRQVIIHSIAEWYTSYDQYDQQKLSRILDIAQDLKV